MSFKVVLYVRLLPSCLVVHIRRIEYVASHYIRRAKTEVCAEHRLKLPSSLVGLHMCIVPWQLACLYDMVKRQNQTAALATFVLLVQASTCWQQAHGSGSSLFTWSAIFLLYRQRSRFFAVHSQKQTAAQLLCLAVWFKVHTRSYEPNIVAWCASYSIEKQFSWQWFLYCR